ncbi:MAG: fasciclin domain-containing protein [Xanthobacteraceae bacterium]
MKRSMILAAGVAMTVALSAPAFATMMVGGAPMYPSRNIIQNAVHSKEHTTLVSAVKEAGLVKTLEGPGPFTVFAPTNRAFDKLPHATVAGLMKPSKKGELKSILTYHVLPGRYTTQKLKDEIRADGGKATINTVEGEPLTFTEHDGHIRITDEKGDVAEITQGNVMQSNGVIQVVNSVLMPS